jgi:hypothetical protein
MPHNLFEYHTMGAGSVIQMPISYPTIPAQPTAPTPSVGNRFSFNFPSGKKWTLSKNDDARARAFYCGGGGFGGTGGTGGAGGAVPITNIPVQPQTPTPTPTPTPPTSNLPGPCYPWNDSMAGECGESYNYNLPECVRVRADRMARHEEARKLFIASGFCVAR